jgi:cell division protein FtsQ
VAARRQAVRRRHFRRKTVVLAALAVVSLAVAALWPLAHSGIFSARVLRVDGNHETSTAAILTAAGLESHPPLIDVHGAAGARAVEALPWIATASIATHWPDGVTVTVAERVPVAAVAAGSRWAVVDRTGRVLTLEASPPSGLAHLVSVGTPGGPGTTLRTGRGALAVAAALPAAFASMVTAVSPAPGGGVDLALDNGVGVALGAPEQLPAKFEDVASILAGATLAAGSVIDVSVPPSPAVSPPPSPPHAPGGTATSTNG